MVKYLNAECYKAFHRKYFYIFLAVILSLAAAFMDMPLRKAIPSILLGIIAAGCIMTALTSLGVNAFSAVMT